MKAKPILMYVSLYGGRCGIQSGSAKQILAEQGTSNVQAIRYATADDVAWVRAMGGSVPDGRIKRAAELLKEQAA